jgi:UDP-N-acetylglucosamine transferase subunit ALG13
LILVTTGTVKGYRAMIERADELAATELMDHEVVAQIAHCSYTPKHMAYFRYMEEVRVLFARADLIIGHGGTGTTIEALGLGKRLVGVSDPTLPDNHQREFLDELADRGLLVHCTNLDRLGDAVRQAWTLKVEPIDTSDFGRRLAECITKDLLGDTRRVGRSRRRRGAGIGA